MLFRIKYLIIFFILLNAFSAKAQNKPKNLNKKGSYSRPQTFFQVLADSQSVKHGKYEEWYEGVKIISGQYRLGKKEGLWKYNNIQDDLFFQGNYHDNKKNGQWKYFLKKKPLCIVYYKNDERDSLWQSFYEDHTTQAIANYSNGKKNGSFKVFYENGNLRSEEIYRNDTLIGNQIIYYRQGNIRTNIEFKNGKPYNVISMNDSLGTPLDFGDFKNGTGLLRKYRIDGTKYAEENYFNGIINGRNTTFFNNGKIYTDEHYLEGLKNDSSFTYYKLGTINIRGLYKNGLKSGDWAYYDKTGQQIRSIKYNEEVDTTQNLQDYYEAPYDSQTLELNDSINEIMPKAQGGEYAMMRFIATNVTYPENAREAGISGTVYVTFIINQIGGFEKIRILRGAYSDELNKEAFSVVSKMPVWSPGFQNGLPVRVKFNLPIKFALR